MTNISFDVDPAIAQLVWSGHRNVLFLANNPAISQNTMTRLNIMPNDILVQFNGANFFELCAPINCHKAHVFNANGEGSYWGFSKAGAPARDFFAQTATGTSIFFTKWLSAPAQEFLNRLPAGALGGVIQNDWQPRQYSYPAGKQPSAGFSAVCFYKTINSLRIFCKRPVLQLILVGFSGKYPPGGAWDGHDFGFEQSVYESWLELARYDHEGRPAA